MSNPILQALSNKVNPLSQFGGLLSGQAPEALYNNLMRSNPAFAQFVRQNAGKTVEQIASSYGVNIQDIQRMLRR